MRDIDGISSFSKNAFCPAGLTDGSFLKICNRASRSEALGGMGTNRIFLFCNNGFEPDNLRADDFFANRSGETAVSPAFFEPFIHLRSGNAFLQMLAPPTRARIYLPSLDAATPFNDVESRFLLA